MGEVAGELAGPLGSDGSGGFDLSAFGLAAPDVIDDDDDDDDDDDSAAAKLAAAAAKPNRKIVKGPDGKPKVKLTRGSRACIA
jgi:hypothetical protein